MALVYFKEGFASCSARLGPAFGALVEQRRAFHNSRGFACQMLLGGRLILFCASTSLNLLTKGG